MCMQQHRFSQFLLTYHNGFFNNVSRAFIGKADPSDPLKRENYWRQTLKAITSCRFNVKMSYGLLIYIFCGTVI